MKDLNNLTVFGMRSITVNGYHLHIIKLAFNNTVDNITIIDSILKKHDNNAWIRKSISDRNKIIVEAFTTNYSNYKEICEIVNTIRLAIKTNNLALEFSDITTKLI